MNIANPEDIRKLKKTFAGKELYIAVGTDVIKNASCYKAVSYTHLAEKCESD